MKIKSNVRAGSQTQNQKHSTSTDSTSQINNTVVSYVPAISRCVGI